MPLNVQIEGSGFAGRAAGSSVGASNTSWFEVGAGERGICCAKRRMNSPSIMWELQRAALETAVDHGRPAIRPPKYGARLVGNLEASDAGPSRPAGRCRRLYRPGTGSGSSDPRGRSGDRPAPARDRPKPGSARDPSEGQTETQSPLPRRDRGGLTLWSGGD